MRPNKSNYVPFIAITFLIIIALTGCNKAAVSDEKTVTETKPVPENCLTLHAGTVNVGLVHPEFLSPAWYLTPGSSERTNIRIELSKKVTSEMDEGKTENKIVLIVSDSYLQKVEDIVKFSKIDPGLEYEESTFNGLPAAYSQMVDETEGVWNYYMIPFGNRTIEVSYHQSVLTVDEQAQAEAMLNGVTLSQSTENIERSNVTECHP